MTGGLLVMLWKLWLLAGLALLAASIALATTRHRRASALVFTVGSVLMLTASLRGVA